MPHPSAAAIASVTAISATAIAAAVAAAVAVAAPAPASTPTAPTPSASAAPPAPPAAGDARVQGAFQMTGSITAAFRVSGEHVGQVVQRLWRIAPAECVESACGSLLLSRERGSHIRERVVLRRVAAGVYTGASGFHVALRCRRRTYPRGGWAPYRITLAVTASQPIQGIAYATAIAATYVNPLRTDATPCPLGPVHDAASYTGTLAQPLPSAPPASAAAKPRLTTPASPALR